MKVNKMHLMKELIVIVFRDFITASSSGLIIVVFRDFITASSSGLGPETIMISLLDFLDQ